MSRFNTVAEAFLQNAAAVASGPETRVLSWMAYIYHSSQAGNQLPPVPSAGHGVPVPGIVTTPKTSPLDNTYIPDIPLPEQMILSDAADDPHGRFAYAGVDWFRQVCAGVTGEGRPAAQQMLHLVTSNLIQVESANSLFPRLTPTQLADINAGVNLHFTLDPTIHTIMSAGMVQVMNGRSEFVPIPGIDGTLSEGMSFPRGTQLADVTSYLMASLRSNILKGVVDAPGAVVGG